MEPSGCLRVSAAGGFHFGDVEDHPLIPCRYSAADVFSHSASPRSCSFSNFARTRQRRVLLSQTALAADTAGSMLMSRLLRTVVVNVETKR